MYWKINPYKSQFSHKNSEPRRWILLLSYAFLPHPEPLQPHSGWKSQERSTQITFWEEQGPQFGPHQSFVLSSSKDSKKGINSIWLVVDLPLWKIMMGRMTSHISWKIIQSSLKPPTSHKIWIRLNKYRAIFRKKKKKLGCRQHRGCSLSRSSIAVCRCCGGSSYGKSVGFP